MGRILITGGTGFIGSHLARRLYNKKNKIVIFAKDAYHPFLKGLKIKVIKGDVRVFNAVLKAVRGCDYVYHLAANTSSNKNDKGLLFSTNVNGTENVFKASLKSNVKKVVYVSSGSTLGYYKDERPLAEEGATDFIDNVYAQSKKIGEDKAAEYAKKGLNVSIVLPAYVLGAGVVDKRQANLFRSISSGRIKFTYPGGGGTVAVEDLVDGIILVMEKGKQGERYLLSNEYVRLFDFYNLIARIMKKPKIRLKIPRIAYYPMYILGFALGRLMKNPPITEESVRWHFNYRVYDSAKAKKELGWKPRVTLAESIKRAVEYYKSTGALK